jgi:hypothetical protein
MSVKVSIESLDPIRVRNSGYSILQAFDDGPDGHLVIAESGRNVPMPIKRVYVISGFANRDAVRGRHAHKELDQYIFCLKGSFLLDLDDGDTRQTVSMNSPAFGVRLGPLVWHTMRELSADCVIMVFADDHYDEADYLRNYEEFLEYAGRHRPQ